MKDDLAVSLKDKYATQVESFNDEIHHVLRYGFENSSEDIYHLLCESEKESYSFFAGEMKIVFRQLAN